MSKLIVKEKTTTEFRQEESRKNTKPFRAGVKISVILDKTVDSFGSRSDAMTSVMISHGKDIPGCSIVEVMVKLIAMPRVEFSGDLHIFASQIFC